MDSDENFDVDFLADPYNQSTSDDASNTRSKFLPKMKNTKSLKSPDVVKDPSLSMAQDPEDGLPETESLLPENHTDSLKDDVSLDGEFQGTDDFTTFSSLDDTFTQPLSNLACSSSKFRPKPSSRRKDQELEYVPSARDSFHTDAESPEWPNQAVRSQLHVDSYASKEQGYLMQPNHAAVDFETQVPDQGANERIDPESAEDAPQKSSRLRNKETGRHEQPSKKTKTPSPGIEIPTRRRKQHAETSGSKEQAPVKKKFAHSTKRTRRQVDKKLLETPDEEIDVRKLPLKDLILLTEARERISVKAGITEQPQNNISRHHDFNFDPYEDDDYMGGHDYNFDDEEAIPESRMASTAIPEAKTAPIKLNYHTYMVRSYASRWTKMETEMFYQAIRQFGTDFSMIQQLFPGRTRHQVRLKFKNEERKHPLQIADAIAHPSKDYSHFEEVIQRLQAQAEEDARRQFEMDGPEYESQDATGVNEETDMKKSDGEEQGAEEMSGYNAAKYDDYNDDFDFNDHANAHGRSPYTGKDDFDDTYY